MLWGRWMGKEDHTPLPSSPPPLHPSTPQCMCVLSCGTEEKHLTAGYSCISRPCDGGSQNYSQGGYTTERVSELWLRCFELPLASAARGECGRKCYRRHYRSGMPGMPCFSSTRRESGAKCRVSAAESETAGGPHAAAAAFDARRRKCVTHLIQVGGGGCRARKGRDAMGERLILPRSDSSGNETVLLSNER
ncbi:hypothetical protein JZ751_014334 [Albula glossodonta]|uniref:Uncharacterized protein n=1 Tax=Albula glossodonta TaxID=121402 RepID=A0A8T2NR40_9TELE|nr:hypothetical protein JZ751_014334 [Albula glossodonta]